LSAYGVEFSPVDILHDMPGIALAMDTQANQAKSNCTHV
jgi:hypothetical protein